MMKMPDSFMHPVTGELLSSKEEFLAAIREEEERLTVVYRTLGPLRQEMADRFPPAEMPRPRERTVTQERVMRCPRCGGRLENEEAAEAAPS